MDSIQRKQTILIIILAWSSELYFVFVISRGALYVQSRRVFRTLIISFVDFGNHWINFVDYRVVDDLSNLSKSNFRIFFRLHFIYFRHV